MHHLRKGNMQEWSEFDKHPEANKLIIHFTNSVNNGEQTLSLEQYDVSQPWKVLLNDKKIGELTPDEKYLKTYFAIPPQTILQGDNTLTIEPSDTSLNPVDDVSVGKIILENIPLNELLHQSTIDVEITETDSKQFIPSRITITNKNRFQPVGATSNEQLAVRTGCVFTATGKASFGLPAGTYTIYATRGFEYGVDSLNITLKPGDHLSKKFILKKEVPTDGWVSSDTHIHSLTYSGHGDATIEERVLAIAGEGIEMPVITEHNQNVDVNAVAEKMNVRKYFTPITGNEVTTPVGHFNAFPVTANDSIINYKVTDWNALSRNINKTKTVKAVILNHAQDIHNNFRPFDSTHHISIAGLNLTGWTFPANAMEVMNSGAQMQDIMRLYTDWFGMLNHGYRRLTPVGSSDSHDVIRYLVGQGRTYIRADDSDPAHINIDEAINNFNKGKVMVSGGLLAAIKVDSIYEPGDLVPASEHLAVTVRVLGPSWTTATHVMLYADGEKIKEANITNGKTAGIKYTATWILPKPKHDVFLVAIAEGPGTFIPYWQIAKPFQHTTPDWTPHVIGSSGAIWVDADNDKHFSSAFDYAKKLVENSKDDLTQLIKKLADYDEAVAVQAAAILYQKGVDVNSAAVASALMHASAATKRGFESFRKEVMKVK